MNDELNPPCIAFPEIAAGAIGWRMGQGEDFWDMFYKFFSALTEKLLKITLDVTQNRNGGTAPMPKSGPILGSDP